MRAFILICLFVLVGVDFLPAFDRFYGLENDLPRESQPTSDGGMIIVSETAASSGLWNAWVMKLNADGNIEWQKKFVSGSASWVNSVAETNDGGFIVAGINNGYDAWIAKLLSNGEMEWERNFGGNFDQEVLFSVKQLSDGMFVAAGYVCAPAGPPCDGLVIKLSQDGTVLWVKTYGTPERSETIYSMEQPSGNELICMGFSQSSDPFEYGPAWLLRLDLDGGIVESTGYKASSTLGVSYMSISAVDGRVFVGTDGTGIWIVKVTSGGVIQWQKTYTPLIDDISWGGVLTTIARDGSDFILGGGISAAPDQFIWVMKIDASGNVIWSKTHRVVSPEGFKGANPNARTSLGPIRIGPRGFVPADYDFLDEVTSVHVNGLGDVTVSGQIYNFDCGGWDIFVAQLDSNGNSCFFTEDATVEIDINSPVDVLSQAASAGTGPSEFTSSSSVTNTSASSADACSGFAPFGGGPRSLTAACGSTVQFEIESQPCDENDDECKNERKVLIHKYGLTDDYPSDFQEDLPLPEDQKDRKILIRATVKDSSGQPIPNKDVWFRVKDPADTAPYIPDPQSGDNKDDDDEDSGTIDPPMDESDENGIIETILTLTNQFAGDNYQIEAFFEDPDPEVNPDAIVVGISGIITAWKRVYAERDRMFRRGGLLFADFFGSICTSNCNEIRVYNSTNVNEQDEIVTFDEISSSGEIRTVTAKTYNLDGSVTLTLDAPLEGNYFASSQEPPPSLPKANFINGHSAGIGVIDSGFYETDLGDIAQTFDEAFVEVKDLMSAESTLPYMHQGFLDGGYAPVFRFHQIWFAHQNPIDCIVEDVNCTSCCNVPQNYFHFFGAGEQTRMLGASSKESDFSYLTVQSIEDQVSSYCGSQCQGDEVANGVRNVSAHELAHQFGVNKWAQDRHDSNNAWCGEIDGSCVSDNPACKINGQAVEWCAMHRLPPLETLPPYAVCQITNGIVRLDCSDLSTNSDCMVPDCSGTERLSVRTNTDPE